MTNEMLRSQESANRLADTARNVADQAGQTVEAGASSALDQIATTIEEVAEAIRRAGQELRQDQPQIASVADTAADQVERVATYLGSHEPREMLETVQDTARRQPAIVIGAGIAVGLVLGRLLRSAAPVDGRGTPPDRATGMPSRYATRGTGMSGYGLGGTHVTDVGDPNSSVVAGTRVVPAGGTVDTGGARSRTRAGSTTG